MRTFKLHILILLSVPFALAGCMKGFNDNFSQWRGDEENKDRLAIMYANALPLCDGKSVDAHKACVAKIRSEYSARFADRYRAYYTAASAEQLFASAIVLSYVIEEVSSNNNSTNSSSSSSNSASRKARVCRTNKFSKSHSISLSSFTVIPVTCS